MESADTASAGAPNTLLPASTAAQAECRQPHTKHIHDKEKETAKDKGRTKIVWNHMRLAAGGLVEQSIDNEELSSESPSD